MSERSTNYDPNLPNVIRGILDFASVQSVLWVEVGRASLVNSQYGFPEDSLSSSGRLSPDSPVYSVLQNSGDFFDGYGLAVGGYAALSLADCIRTHLAGKNIPVRFKLAASMFFSMGIVGLVESGVWHGRTTADLNDIPAGIIGALAYGGFNILSRKLVKKMDSESI